MHPRTEYKREWRKRKAEGRACQRCGGPLRTLGRDSQRFCSMACAKVIKSPEEIARRIATFRRTGPLKELWAANGGYEFSNKKEYQRARLIWVKYSLPWPQYIELYKKGSGGCWVCGVAGRLAVDHKHETGEVRGLLCVTCNVAMGRFESAEWREKASRYLNTQLPA